MSFLKTLVSVGSAILEDAKKQQANRMRNGVKNASTGKKEIPKIAGKTLREWEGQWQYAGELDSMDLGRYSHSVGLYKAEQSGKVMYVGRAVEFRNGGLRKRLSDYTRESDSGRKHNSGQLMHANASKLSIYVLIVGDNEEAAVATRKLEQYFISQYNPPWNKMRYL